MYLGEKVSVPSISLYGLVIHICAHDGTIPSWIRRSPLDVGRLRGGAMRMVGWTDWWRVGEKKVKSPYLRAAGAARDSSKIEAIPVVATLRMAERSDTFRWMRVLQRYRLRYGTFVHFTLIAKYGAPASMQKKERKGQKIEVNSLAN